MFLTGLMRSFVVMLLMAVADGSVGDAVRVFPDVTCSRDDGVGFKWKLPSQSSCFVELRSWGRDDSSQVGYASINDVIVANYTNQNDTVVRGFNTQLLQTNNCAAYDSRHFDTGASNSTSVKLVKYIQSLTNGTILYGVTCDEVTSSLTADARSALMAIGVNVTELVYRGKLTFVAVIGRPKSTVFSVASNGSENLITNLIIAKASDNSTETERGNVTSPVNDVIMVVPNVKCSVDNSTEFKWKLLTRGYCYIELRSWGFADSSQTGYARVNGRLVDNYERPNHNEQVRGFNIYVLRLSDCTTTDSKHFDTWDREANGSYDLGKYLGSLSPGTVVYGATCDDATYALSSVARDALLKIGVNATSLVLRGKLTFVALIGRLQSTVFRIAGSGGDNLFMDALVSHQNIDFSSVEMTSRSNAVTLSSTPRSSNPSSRSSSNSLRDSLTITQGILILLQTMMATSFRITWPRFSK